MSSHREAPSISKDPAADNTDVYAFRTPGDTITIIANYSPGQAPNGGPNFYEFDDEVLYSIHIDNDGDGEGNINFEFRFTTVNTNPNTFLYNTGPIDSLDSPNWNRRQTYSVVRRSGKANIQFPGDSRRRIPTRVVELGTGLSCPPANVGPRSTPNYEALAAAAVYELNFPFDNSTMKVFAGQRADAFFVDLGSIFDLGALRPFQNFHLISTAAAAGVDALANANCQSICIQLPITAVSGNRKVPSEFNDGWSTIGVYASASRQRGLRIRNGVRTTAGPYEQISRLGNPLFNEVITPLAKKDQWNADAPEDDAQYARFVLKPELATLLPVLYPGVFPNLAAFTGDRADLAAILLTGIPEGIVPGFQNFTGTTQADVLRLNMAIPPTPTADENPIGLVAGDPAGFPNGRRLRDDVTAIELKAIAGATLPLVDPSFTPDATAALLEDGTNPPERTFLDEFPYIGTPYDGFSVGT
ncbi:MAG TPA: DUF4331 domain-containing protein [Ilumatobacteraceae bacterium]|nr:DUF4331 domain-containing protein [Ilumatobacteraceae bacterium]